jgi:hypothetical protein
MGFVNFSSLLLSMVRFASVRLNRLIRTKGRRRLRSRVLDLALLHHKAVGKNSVVDAFRLWRCGKGVQRGLGHRRWGMTAQTDIRSTEL